jgi:hypothetical protein
VREEVRQAQAQAKAAASNPQLANENTRLQRELEQVKANTVAQVAVNACQNNLRQIQAAAQQWGLEKQKPAGTPVTPADLLEVAKYIPGGKIPTCPSGGTYGLFVVGTPPPCSVPGHAVR